MTTCPQDELAYRCQQCQALLGALTKENLEKAKIRHLRECKRKKK